MKSIYELLPNSVEFPEFKERYLYMHKTSIKDVVLPEGLEDYVSVIQQMTSTLKEKDAPCYITIHERHIKNSSHRVPGIHVDFNWFEDLQRHGGGSHGKRLTEKGGMLLASNYMGCKAWKGEFDGYISDKGCCKTIDVSNLESTILESNNVYYLNALGIHESLQIDGEVKRSLIRINFHPDYEFIVN